MTNHSCVAEELVGNDKRPYGVVSRAAARVADDMRVALRQTGVFGRVQARVHAGQDCESASRRQRQLALFAETPDIGLIGRDDLANDFRHDALLD
jgi:type IV pilus biogenesis protein CpaD/CtpE